MDPLQQSIRLMGGVTLDLDQTLLIQATMIVVLMFLLKKLIFEPYLKTIDTREEKTASTREQAGELQAKITELRTNYESSLDGARQRAASLRQELRQEGVASKEQSISAASNDANKVMGEAQAQIEAEFETARAELKNEIDGLANLVVEKVIGRGA
jgi:F-type H+-transporting ATPase subunit b